MVIMDGIKPESGVVEGRRGFLTGREVGEV